MSKYLLQNNTDDRTLLFHEHSHERDNYNNTNITNYLLNVNENINDNINDNINNKLIVTEDCYVKHNLIVHGNSKLGSIYYGIPLYSSDILKYKYFIVCTQYDYNIELPINDKRVLINKEFDFDQCQYQYEPLEYENIACPTDPDYNHDDHDILLDGYDIFVYNNSSCDITVNNCIICPNKCGHFLYAEQITKWITITL
jgi:hypothetical protein